MTIEEDILKWLHKSGTPEAVKVLGFKEEEIGQVICGEGTCWDSRVCVTIYYENNKGYDDEDWYEGELTDFIKELTDG